MGLAALAVLACRLPHAGANSAPCPYQVSDAGAYVTDVQTHLLWQAAASTKQYKLADAQTYCAALGAGWRVPSIGELQTIVDEGTSNPAIDQATFTDGLAGPFWSSTPYAPTPTSAWGVSFVLGETLFAAEGTKQYVRCVRDA